MESKHVLLIIAAWLPFVFVMYKQNKKKKKKMELIREIEIKIGVLNKINKLLEEK